MFRSLHSPLAADTNVSISNITGYPWKEKNVVNYFIHIFIFSSNFQGFSQDFDLLCVCKTTFEIIWDQDLKKKGVDSQNYEIKNTDEDFSHK